MKAGLRFLACALLAAGCGTVGAARISVKLVKKDVAHRTLVFAIRNGEPYGISVCLSNQLTMNLPPSDHLQLAPLYLERFERGKWGTLIGSDTAFGKLDGLDAGQTEEFMVAMPDRGRYRAVMDYSDGAKVLSECQALYDGKFRKVRSAPLDIEQDRPLTGDSRPQLIPRRP